MTAWFCDACTEEIEGVSIGDLKRAGALVEPTDPGAECSRCGNRPPEAVRLRLLLERLAFAHAAPAPERRPADASAPPPSAPPGPRLYSFHEAAKLLRLDRVKTLPRLVESGILRAVPWGEHERRLVAEDVDRVQREGLPVIPGRTRKPPKGPQPASPVPVANRRRRRRRSNGPGDSIRQIPLDHRG